MKSRIPIAMAFCVSLVSTSYAQSIPKARLNRLEAEAKELHLTHAQEKRLLPILRTEEPKLQTIRNNQLLSRAEKLRMLQAVHKQSDPQVKAILTPKQYQQLQSIRQERRERLLHTAKSNPHLGGAARSARPPHAQR
jgi:hypothetical protein